jgi:hypothetical protein
MEQKGNFYFKRSNGEEILLAENITQEQAFVKMKEFMDSHNYKSYYTRTTYRDNERWYDVGSWSEFFVLRFSDKKGE